MVTNERHQLFSFNIQIRTILRGDSGAMRYVVSEVDKQPKSLLVCNPGWRLSLWIVSVQGDAFAYKIYSPEGKWFYFVVAKIAMW